MRSHPLTTLRLITAPTQDIGTGPLGTRVTFPINGGSFEGRGFAARCCRAATTGQ